MSDDRRELGIVGLGRMGGGLALQALTKGIRVVGYTQDGAGRKLVEAGLEEVGSWLIDLMEEAYRAEGGLDGIPPYVEDTGEVSWLVADALQMEVPIPVIAQSVQQLFASRDDRRLWARAIAMMRHGFGGHPYGADEAIRRERVTGRVRPG